ncbi:hypothetical protein [Micromonospora echinospora]|uniref:hypothetical protein n=1 Tax=Micromonospora echinospora TaxID=1877 RepID=UPI00366FA9F1
MYDIRVRLGEELRIDAADRNWPEDGPVTLRVTGVRLVGNRPQGDGWVWLEGMKFTSDDPDGLRTQILVRAAFLAGEGPRR